jgi:hypothetical protein
MVFLESEEQLPATVLYSTAIGERPLYHRSAMLCNAIPDNAIQNANILTSLAF